MEPTKQTGLDVNINVQVSERQRRVKGIFMVLVGSILWGVSGTAAQVLFRQYQFNPGWLVTIRMFASGLCLLMAVSLRLGSKRTFAIWRHPKDFLRLILFGVLGLLGVQYTYFAAINAGNAATATLLQYVAPVLIALYLAMRWRHMPTLWQCSAVILALLGTFLLLTNGRWDGLSVSSGAVVWGLASALALAFYTLYPGQLIAEYGSATMVGWGMLIGGFVMGFVNPPWDFSGISSLDAWLLICFVVLFGTLTAFYLYIASTNYIPPSETSLLASAEPLSAAIVAVLFLHVHMGVMAMIGGLCIVGTVVILGLAGRKT